MGSRNEMVIEDAIGTERIRIHTPRENTTIQLGGLRVVNRVPQAAGSFVGLDALQLTEVP